MAISAKQVVAILSALEDADPSPCPTAPAPSFGSDWKIVVADRGFVLHGRVRREGEYIVIEDCVCVRYWGTPSTPKDSGLGYLARLGPTAETKIDHQPTTRIHELQVVQLIDCVKGGAW